MSDPYGEFASAPLDRQPSVANSMEEYEVKIRQKLKAFLEQAAAMRNKGRRPPRLSVSAFMRFARMPRSVLYERYPLLVEKVKLEIDSHKAVVTPSKGERVSIASLQRLRSQERHRLQAVIENVSSQKVTDLIFALQSDQGERSALMMKVQELRLEIASKDEIIRNQQAQLTSLSLQISMGHANRART